MWHPSRMANLWIWEVYFRRSNSTKRRLFQNISSRSVINLSLQYFSDYPVSAVLIDIDYTTVTTVLYDLVRSNVQVDCYCMNCIHHSAPKLNLTPTTLLIPFPIFSSGSNVTGVRKFFERVCIVNCALRVSSIKRLWCHALQVSVCCQ